MTYEVEILDGWECHTDLTLNQVRQYLKSIDQDTDENIQIITQLGEFQTAQFGTHLVTCTGEREETDEETHNLEELATMGFWFAMEQNEREFQEYLATNPTPFEKKMATLEYLNNRIANEQKYCMLLMNMEREEWLSFQTRKTVTPTSTDEDKGVNEDEDSTEDFEDEWI